MLKLVIAAGLWAALGTSASASVLPGGEAPSGSAGESLAGSAGERLDPGPDQPPVGRSLLDFMMATEDGSAASVPFPIEQLVARLASRSGVQPRVVIIPKGRSLLRDATDYAAPELVFGFTDNGMPGGSTLGAYTKDRLFLAYADRADELEAISYNAGAGRFEFQLIKDYKVGGKPRVEYADRSLCMSCHQNGAAVFPPAPWSETTTPDVAGISETAKRTLAAVGIESIHGYPIAGDADTAYRLSAAVARASKIAPLQKLWQGGCGEGHADAPRCRADVLLLALGGGAKAPALPTAERVQAFNAVTAAWKRYWPEYLGDGLAVPSHLVPPPAAPLWNSGAPTSVADLANANLAPAARQRLTAMLGASTVPSSADPLVQRAPQLETWSLDHGGCYGSCLIFGIGDMFTSVDKIYVASLTGGDDARLKAAIDALVADGDDSLGNHAFRRGAVLTALAKQLGDHIGGAFFDEPSPSLPPLSADRSQP